MFIVYASVSHVLMGSTCYLFDEYKLDFVWLLSTFSSSLANVAPTLRFLAKAEG